MRSSVWNYFVMTSYHWNAGEIHTNVSKATI